MNAIKTLSENKLAAALIAALLIAGGGWLAANTNWPWVVNREHIEENEEHLEVHDTKFSGVAQVSTEILARLDSISSRQELFVDFITSADARAQVMISPGVKINRAGQLDKYLIFARRMEITNNDHPERPSVVVEVEEETFHNADAGLVLKVGRDIANRLEVPLDQWFFRVSVRRVE